MMTTPNTATTAMARLTLFRTCTWACRQAPASFLSCCMRIMRGYIINASSLTEHKQAVTAGRLLLGSCGTLH